MFGAMKLIIGLGNPGKEYAGTRHNVGFRCINRLAKKHGISLKQRGSQAQFGIGEIEGNKVVLAKPRTFMNLSGNSLKLLIARFKVMSSDILIIHDELDLPLGKIRLYTGGGSGGHKGVESIIDELEGRDFIRIRLGIGRPPEDDPDAVDYVLSDFSPDEDVIIEDTIVKVTEAIQCLLREGMTAAMNKFN
jgi:PTH1 family peptidyl-tRNA hydrolase